MKNHPKTSTIRPLLSAVAVSMLVMLAACGGDDAAQDSDVDVNDTAGDTAVTADSDDVESDTTGDTQVDTADDTQADTFNDTATTPTGMILTLTPAGVTGMSTGGGLQLQLEQTTPTVMTGGGWQLRLQPSGTSPSQARGDLP
ncbi:MAG: hypothetical protein ACI9MR_004480 [Myxococcota bacterium]|jgi:hypothetical protein